MTTTTATTAAQRLADRIGRISPHRVQNMIELIEAGTLLVGGADEQAIILRAARQNLATRLDRFWQSDRPVGENLVQVVDQAHQRVAFVCHPDTAAAWLRWYTGEAAHNTIANVDYRVCACGRLSSMHSSHNADGAFLGIGNGECGESRCAGFRPVVERPARFAQ